MQESRMNPMLNELNTMKQRMDALYCRSFRKASENGCEESAPAGGPDAWAPNVDLYESGDEWVIVADVPGVKDTDLSVELVEEELVIKGRRNGAPSGEGLMIAQAERIQGAFSRSFMLPQPIRQEDIEAELKLGVLTVRVPRVQSSPRSSHTIKVNTD